MLKIRHFCLRNLPQIKPRTTKLFNKKTINVGETQCWQESVKSAQYVGLSMEESVVEKTWGRGQMEGVIDGESGGDNSVDPTCVGGEKGKDWDVDEAHGKNEEVDFRGGVLHIKENGVWC